MPEPTAKDAAIVPVVTDIVVIGAGASGMTAALAAAKNGASVVVPEKAAKLGGSAFEPEVMAGCAAATTGAN